MDSDIAEKKSRGRPMEQRWCWVALAAMTYNMFVIDGSVRCYGLLYQELLTIFGAGPERTGYVATVFALCGAILSPFAGLIMDRLSARVLLLILPFVFAIGAIISAFSTSLGMIFFGYSCLMGASNTSMFVANTAEVTRLFKYNRTLASGIAFAGGSMGSMVYPLLFTVLANIYTVRGVFIIVYAGLGVNIIVSSFLLRFENVYPEELPLEHEMVAKELSNINEVKTYSKLQKERQLYAEEDTGEANLILDREKGDNMPEITTTGRKSCQNRCLETTLKLLNIKFLSTVLFYVTWVFSLYGFQMYTPAYAEELGLSKIQGSLLLSVCAGSDLVSRLLIGFLGNLKCVNIYIMITVNMTVTGIFCIFVPTLLLTGEVFAVLLASMVIIGLWVGGLTSLLGQLVAEAVGTDFAGIAFGILNVSFCLGIGLPPLVYGRMKVVTGSYSSVAQISGAVMILCGFLVQIGQVWNKCRTRLNRPRRE